MHNLNRAGHVVRAFKGSRGTKFAVAAALAAACGVSVSSAVGAAGPTGPADPPAVPADAFAGYVAPSGPVLGPQSVRHVALAEASRDGDAAPASVTLAAASLGRALSATDPQYAAPAAVSVGQAAWLASSVDVVTLRGAFTLNAPVPRGESLPSGSVLVLVLDAHTGQIAEKYVGQAAPSGLAQLGQAVSLS